MVTLDIDEILFRVYCARIDADCGEGTSDRMIAKDGDGGAKQRRRAECFRRVVVETLVQAGVYQRPERKPPQRKMEVW